MTRPSPVLPRVDRRAFLAGALASGALVVGCDRFGKPRFPITVHERTDVPLNAWVVIGADDTVTFLIDEAEMGQGVLTALSMVLAEELGADWSKVRAECAICDPSRYGYQGTAASTSVREQEPKLRKMGAGARAMLLAAAAESWQTDAAGLTVERGQVIDPATSRRMSFGALAAAAATQQAPTDPPLLARGERWLTGTSPPRLDVPDKITGRAVYGLDVRVPGMLFAAISRAPGFGGKIAAVDDTATRAVDGVRDVVRTDDGVAVLADHTWGALAGRRALKVTTDDRHDKLSTEELTERLRNAASSEAAVLADKRGEGAAALQTAAKTIERVFDAPLVAHAPLEPLNSTARVAGGKVELWAPTQAPTEAQWAAAAAAGVDDSDVLMRTTFIGGGFGRKGNKDFIEPSVALSKKVGRPVQVVYDREDDLAGGWYRPAACCKGTVGLDDKGAITALSARLASVPIFVDKGLDPTGVEGFKPLLYAIPHVEVHWAEAKAPMPVGFWRSVGSSQNAFFVEGLIDAAARAGGRDPLALRLDLLPKQGDAGRLRAVVERVAAMADWGKAPAEGHARGLACAPCFGSFAAQIVDVSLDEGGPRVHEVWCAFECGPALHPDNVVAQVDSAIVYGLSAALYQHITLKGGVVQQQSFDTFPLLRFDEMPTIHVDILPSTAPLGGVGEPATPPIAPAVAAAVQTLTGSPVTALPMRPPA
jgi:isoquinoline 1-oxidoreductase beta subunit